MAYNSSNDDKTGGGGGGITARPTQSDTGGLLLQPEQSAGLLLSWTALARYHMRVMYGSVMTDNFTRCARPDLMRPADEVEVMSC